MKMKTTMKFAAVALAGCAALAGCVCGSKLTPEQEEVVGAWRDQTQMLIDARDPDLTAECKSGIAEVDAIANTVTPISMSVNKLINDKIRETQAAAAWNTYVGWKNGPEANKLSGDALAAASARQARLACFEQGLTLNSTDADADALKVFDFRQLTSAKTRADEATLDAFLAENGSEALNTWAAALERSVGTGREAFYEAIGVEATDWEALIPDLTKYSSDIADATKRVSTVLKNPTVKEVMIQYALGSLGQATVGDGINVQEAGDAILRLQKQLAVTSEQLPWLIDAIQASE